MSAIDKDVDVGYVPDEDAQDKDSPPDPAGKEPCAEEAKKKAHHRRPHPHLKEVEEKLREAVCERDEMKDKYLRNLAEMDNFHKRIRKEKEEYRKYVLGDFLLELLIIVDNLERALKAKNEANEKGILAGVEIIYKQFLELLKKNQVNEIEAQDKPFDPHFHQALAKEETEGIHEPRVVEVYQKGFLYQGKVLRPALTKVAIPVENEKHADPN